MTTETLTISPSAVEYGQLFNDESFRDANGGVWTSGRNGNRWLLTLSYRNLTGTRRRAMWAHVVESRGQQNRIRVAPVARLGHTQAGTGGGSPVLNGGHNAGDTVLATTGGTGSLTGGDFVTIGNELKMVTTTAAIASIEIWPELHQDYVTSTAIEVATPHGDFVVIDASGMSAVPHPSDVLNTALTLVLEEDTRA